MTELRVIEYDHHKGAARRVDKEVWASHEPRIRELFALSVTQKQMRENLQGECVSGSCGSGLHPCSFRPSASQFSRQLLAWDLRILESRQTRIPYAHPAGSFSQRSFTQDGFSGPENTRPGSGVLTRQSVSIQRKSTSHGNGTSTSPSELIFDFTENCESGSHAGEPCGGSTRLSSKPPSSPSEKFNISSQGLPTTPDTPIKPADDWLSSFGIRDWHMECLVHWCAFAISCETVGIEAVLQGTTILDTKAATKLHCPEILYRLFFFSWLDRPRRRRLSIMAGKEDLWDLFGDIDVSENLSLFVLYTLSSMITKHTNEVLAVPTTSGASLSIKAVLFSVTISLCKVMTTFVEEFLSTSNPPPPRTIGKRNRPKHNHHVVIGEGVCLLCINVMFEQEVKGLVTKPTPMDRYLNEPEFRNDVRGRNLAHTFIHEDNTLDEGYKLGSGDEDIDNEASRSSMSGSFKKFRDLANGLKQNPAFLETSKETGKSLAEVSFHSRESRMSWRFSRVTGMSSNPSNRDSHSIRDSINEDAMDTS